MARIEVATSKRIVVTSTKARMEAIITTAVKKIVFTIRVNSIAGVSAADLTDYAEGMRKLCTKLGKEVRKTVSVRGTRIDPDEPAQEPGADITVSFQIFPKDTTKHLTFTRYAEDGRVKASLQGFTFTDIPSAIQVAFVAEQAANLMKKYADL